MRLGLAATSYHGSPDGGGGGPVCNAKKAPLRFTIHT